MEFDSAVFLVRLDVPRYVPNELRQGMICLSEAPATATILGFLVQRFSCLAKVCSWHQFQKTVSLSRVNAGVHRKDCGITEE
ncbi:hypothetical protein PanWU01x14_357160 [Parasponia andersonii]|uniref:Uncharacterized protein n=1 Tax=Parasponia andersonii TaxID=3476 RepID=A0A2P5A8N5_PARAD|nr:hypothetical protein PanWU01x14_357160 [Parasponia andersonii]